LQEGAPVGQPKDLQLVEDIPMKTLITVLMLSLMIAGTVYAIEAGDNSLGAYSDMNGDGNCFTVVSGVPFNIYWVMARPVFANLGGFEFSWRFEPSPSHFILSTTMPPGALNIGTPTDMVVGLGLGLTTTEATLLVTHQVMFMAAAENVIINAGPAPVDSIDGEGAYNNFEEPNDIRPFNWSTVATQSGTPEDLTQDNDYRYFDVPVEELNYGWLRFGLAGVNGPCPAVGTEATTMGNIKALWK
jgi:hypothetical protein